MEIREHQEFLIEFGLRGNLAEYGTIGWGDSDQNHTRMRGQTSGLWLPRPSTSGTYILEISVHPLAAKTIVLIRNLAVSVNGRQVGFFEVNTARLLECKLEWELISGGEAIAVHFVQSNTGSEDHSETTGEYDGIAFETLRLVRVEEQSARKQAHPAPAAKFRAKPDPKEQIRIIGSVDGLRAGAIEGWALVWPSFSDCLIEVTDNRSGALLARGQATSERPDLIRLGYGRNNVGFKIFLEAITDEIRDVRVTANGIELPGSPVPVDLQRYAVELNIQDGCVLGSVRDSFNTRPPPEITFTDQDDTWLGEVTPKPDGSGDTVQGYFKLTLPTSSFGRSEYVVRAFIGKREVARTECDLRLEGHLDELTPYLCSGWLLLPGMPSTRLHIEVLRDGKVVASGECRRPRYDVRDIFPEALHCGFELKISAEDKRLYPGQVSIRLRETDSELFGGPFVAGNRASIIETVQTAMRIAAHPDARLPEAAQPIVQSALEQFCRSLRQTEAEYVRFRSVAKRPERIRRLNIIIPIYRGALITKACIDSVLEHRRPDVDSVILINDCSPEPEMALLLQQYLRQPNVFLLTNEENQGFVRSVNRGMQFCGDGDLLLLNSDTTVFTGGFDELYRIAHSADDIATVTAISNNATIFTYPHPEMACEKLDDVSWADLAAAALRHNTGTAIDVPTGHGFCMLLKREMVDRLGFFDEGFGRGYGEENEWCCRASDLGYRHVAAGAVFVEHRESISFGDDKEAWVRANAPRLSRMFPEYDDVIKHYRQRDELRRVRWALDFERLQRACTGGNKFVLVIENSLGGGSAVAVADIEGAVGYGGARKLGLAVDPDRRLVLTASDPAITAVFQDRDLHTLFALLDRLGIELVLIHQLLGYNAEFIERLSQYCTGKRVFLFAHDYYSFCPRATMINAIGEFCNQNETTVCTRCLELDGSHEFSGLTDLQPEEHRALFKDLMGRVQQVVAPSNDAAARLRSVFSEAPVRVIAHPQSHIRPGADLPSGSFDNVILLGALGPHKGSAILVDLARRAFLSQPQLKFHVIGYTDRDNELLKIGNVFISGAYEPADLTSLIREANGRIALFLSGWPETFSYTLSEAAQHGLIPLVPDIGALAERVREADWGVVFPFPITAETVLATIGKVTRGELQWGQGTPKGFNTTASSAVLKELFLGVSETTVAPRSKRAAAKAGRAQQRRLADASTQI